MKITMITAGSRGDVQPYIALAKGLGAAGHDLTLLATDDFEELITGTGLKFISTGENVQEILQSEEWRGKAESGNFLAIQSQLREELKKRMRKMVPMMVEASRDTDLIIGGMGGLAGGFAVAEKFDIPILDAHVFPLTPTSAYGSPLTPKLPFGNSLNKISFHATRQILWHSLRVGDVVTREMLNLPQVSFWGPFAEFERRQVPVIYGYSRHVLPRPDDMPEHHHVCGYWFLDEDDSWTAPDDLLAFLDASDPPVYIGFGSMGNSDPKAAGEIALAALERSGQRGILSAGWGGLTAEELPETVFAVSSLPHSWLFPRMVAVVHHGGAGTTAAGFRAGVPSIIVPFMGDQPFWGHRVAQLGVGTEPIPRKKLTAENLGAALTRVVSDRTMQSKAIELGAKIRDEDSIGQVAALIERLYAPAAQPTPS